MFSTLPCNGSSRMSCYFVNRMLILCLLFGCHVGFDPPLPPRVGGTHGSVQEGGSGPGLRTQHRTLSTLSCRTLRRHQQIFSTYTHPIHSPTHPNALTFALFSF